MQEKQQLGRPRREVFEFEADVGSGPGPVTWRHVYVKRPHVQRCTEHGAGSLRNSRSSATADNDLVNVPPGIS